MEESLLVDVYFNSKFINNEFSVKKRLLFNFFYSSKYTTKSGKRFSINTLNHERIKYNIDKVEAKNSLSLSFFTSKNDERPFVICVEKEEGKTLYYGLRSKKDFQWREIEDQGLLSKNEENDVLLYVLKNQYSKFFESVLSINNDVIFNLSYNYEDINYDIVHSGFYDYYDKYHFKPDKSHSVKGVKLFGRELSFGRDLDFVQDFYFYYVTYDLTTPLLIETFEFRIGDKAPIVHYYIASSVDSYKWIDAYPDSNLTYPRCEGEIGRILTSIVMKYQDYPIQLDIKFRSNLDDNDHYTKFDGLSFYIGHLYNLVYGYYVYYPRVGNTFLIDNVVIDNVAQDIQVQGREYRHVFIYYLNKMCWKPILICFGLRNESIDNLTYIWYKIVDGVENKWEQIDFQANPNAEHDMIEEKINSLFMTKVRVKSIRYKGFWVSIFTLGAIVGTYLGVHYSERIISSLGRFYNKFRRLRVR